LNYEADEDRNATNATLKTIDYGSGGPVTDEGKPVDFVLFYWSVGNGVRAYLFGTELTIISISSYFIENVSNTQTQSHIKHQNEIKDLIKI